MESPTVIFFEQESIGEDNFNKIWDYSQTIGAYPCAYEKLIERDWFDSMGFCGCGCPEDAQEYMASILQSMKDRSATSWGTDNVEATVKGSPDAMFYFVMYVLDAMGLAEHGGSIGGSWLTEKGEKMLNRLKKPSGDA